MNHLLDIHPLSQHDILALIQRALSFKHSPQHPRYPDHTLANLFYENSTRTRVSFELAANKLAMPVINVDLAHSSEHKGETIQDTVQTLAAMGIQLFVIRHAQEGLPHALAHQCKPGMHVINAGDGQHAHPSQALLDLMTIMEQKPDLTRLKIAIVGDLRHSRVANSLQQICATLNVGELTLVSPVIWKPTQVHFGRTTTSLRDGISNADVVICLRVQQERLNADEHLNLADYRRDYALTETSMAWAKPDAMVMHPGPINRGVELESSVADGPHSFILEQVKNGVYMRMAIIEHLLIRSNQTA
ncbi:MAG TPA: aspartate carbamoyltransferase [Legionella sp.]|nr:aspartate carbamoyltransferase [Legionella sp.]